MNFWTRLDAIAAEGDVLRHPFYVRWSAGTLTADELAYYAGQYRHAVVALAAAAAGAARSPEARADAPALAAHATDEAAHVALWDEFVEQAGGDVAAEPTPETLACAREWSAERPLLHSLIAMYAIESAQPAIAQTKLTGLAEHYGIASSPYFELHRRLDIEHAAGERAIIEERLAGADEDALLQTAERVLKANWLLLDGVDAG
jgi:pyrroloquinoline-quinone synthase